MSNVVSIFSAKTKKEDEKEDVVVGKIDRESDNFSFELIIQQNKEKAAKLSKERLGGNKKVLKSYRIKH